MLTRLLSRDSCAACRICCGFDEGDIWEAPVILPPMKEKILGEFPEQGFSGNILAMEKSADGLYYCPMLTTHGCALGAEKPFDCQIWPFRVMDFCGKLVITLSPVCPTLWGKSVGEISALLADGLAEKIFSMAEQFPAIIKPYTDGSPIFLVR